MQDRGTQSKDISVNIVKTKSSASIQLSICAPHGSITIFSFISFEHFCASNQAFWPMKRCINKMSQINLAKKQTNKKVKLQLTATVNMYSNMQLRWVVLFKRHLKHTVPTGCIKRQAVPESVCPVTSLSKSVTVSFRRQIPVMLPVKIPDFSGFGWWTEMRPASRPAVCLESSTYYSSLV